MIPNRSIVHAPHTVIRRLVLPVLALACCIGLSGCVIIGDKVDQIRWHLGTVPYYVFDNAPNYHEPAQPAVMEEPVNVCIAISGGGPRSAVFAAGVMEQLAALPNPRHPGKSVLESCDVVSGVSGGSFAAAYYGLFKPDTLSDPQTNTEFFQRFKSNMTVDLFSRGWIHYVSHPWEGALKYWTRYQFASTLANTLDQYIFQGATFDHLAEREACGQSPVILLNATSLDTGQKFIFSNLNITEHMNPDPASLTARLAQSAPRSDLPTLGLLAQIHSQTMFRCFGFESIDSDIGALRLSTAVAASSAYPVLPGPLSLINYRNNGYVHLADGGVNDNFGIDSLISMYLKKIEHTRRHRRLVVISINSGAPLIPAREFDPDGYVSSINYGERASTVLVTRGQTFATALYNSSSSIKVIPVNLAESQSASRIALKNTTYRISERDMNIVLQAATEMVTRQSGYILGAIAGRSAAH